MTRLSMDAPPQPKVSFLRTKRFWFRWAVPGLLLALWVEGMLFELSLGFSYFTATTDSSYFLSLRKGNLSQESFCWAERTTGTYSFKLDDFNASQSWYPGWSPFPWPFYEETSYDVTAIPIKTWTLTIPLWIPLILWLLIAHLWSRYQKRKQAALQ